MLHTVHLSLLVSLEISKVTLTIKPVKQKMTFVYAINISSSKVCLSLSDTIRLDVFSI